jgi:hypothetical protein
MVTGLSNTLMSQQHFTSQGSILTLGRHMAGLKMNVGSCGAVDTVPQWDQINARIEREKDERSTTYLKEVNCSYHALTNKWVFIIDANYLSFIYF